MKKFAFGIAALALMAVTVPASAQVSIRGGDEGVRVRIGNDHDRWDHRRNWRHHRADCRVIKERTRTPSGRVVVRTTRTCR